MENAQGKEGGAEGAGDVSGWTGTRYTDAGVTGIVGFVGQPGCGKSYRAWRLVHFCSRVVIFNSAATYGNGPRKTPVPGFVEIRQPGDLKAYLSQRVAGRFRVLYSPLSDAVEHFEAVCKIVLAVRDVVFLVDEIWWFQKTASSPRDLETMMLMGRHYGVTLVWTAQRPQKTDSSLRSVSTELYIGSLPSELDQAAFHGTVPDDALSVAARLPARRFVHRRADFSWCVEK